MKHTTTTCDETMLVHEVVSMRLYLMVLKCYLGHSSLVFLKMWQTTLRAIIEKESSSSKNVSKPKSSSYFVGASCSRVVCG